MAEPVTVSERRTDEGPTAGLYTNDVRTSRHHLFVDEPIALGSSDIGPTPFEYLAAALGGCTTITLRMYCERKKWPVSHLSCEVKMLKEGGRQIFERLLTIEGDLEDAQRARMVEIAEKCPVHKVLTHGADVTTKLA